MSSRRSARNVAQRPDLAGPDVEPAGGPSQEACPLGPSHGHRRRGPAARLALLTAEGLRDNGPTAAASRTAALRARFDGMRFVRT